MNELPHLTYRQYQAVQRLVHSCCNNLDGNCLLLDDGEECVCPQSISRTLICRWFRMAVLPVDRELCAALFPPPSAGPRRCKECRRLFSPPKHNTLYCPKCAADRAKRSKREWARKKRAGM